MIHVFHFMRPTRLPQLTHDLLKLAERHLPWAASCVCCVFVSFHLGRALPELKLNCVRGVHKFVRGRFFAVATLTLDP